MSMVEDTTDRREELRVLKAQARKGQHSMRDLERIEELADSLEGK